MRLKKIPKIESPDAVKSGTQTTHTMNSASEILYEWLWENYNSMSGSEDDWIDHIDPKSFAEEECTNWLDGTYELEDDDEVLYPPWVPLVVTPAISATVDWDEIKKRIITEYKKTSLYA